MSLSAATLKRRSRTGRNSSVGNVVPSSSAKSSSKAPRIPLKDLQGTQEQADSTGDAVVKLFDESEVNPFGTRSKLARTPDNKTADMKKENDVPTQMVASALLQSKSASKPSSTKSCIGRKRKTIGTESVSAPTSLAKNSPTSIKRRSMRNSIASVPKLARTPMKGANNDILVETIVESEEQNDDSVDTLQGQEIVTPVVTSVQTRSMKSKSPAPASVEARALRNSIATSSKIARTPIKKQQSTPLVETSNDLDTCNTNNNGIVVESEKKTEDPTSDLCEKDDNEGTQEQDENVEVATYANNDAISPSAKSDDSRVSALTAFTEKIDDVVIGSAVGEESNVDNRHALHLDDTVEATAEIKSEKVVTPPRDEAVAKRTRSASAKKATPKTTRPSTARRSRRLSVKEKAVEADGPVVRVSMVPNVPPTPPLSPSLAPVSYKESEEVEGHQPLKVSSSSPVVNSDVCAESIEPAVRTEPNINAASFPSTEVFNEMVDLSISMVNAQFASINDAIDSTMEAQKPLPKAPPLDAMGRYLLHPSEFRELLKAFQSPPKKSERKKSRPSIGSKSSNKKKSGAKKRKSIVPDPMTSNKETASAVVNNRESYLFSIEELEALRTRSFDCNEQEAEEMKKRFSLLTTASTVMAAASSAINNDDSVNELERPNPFAAKKPMVFSGEAHITFSPPVVKKPVENATEDEKIVEKTADEGMNSIAIEDEIPIMEEFCGRLSSERMSIEPFKRLSLEVRRQSGHSFRRLPRGSLCGPVDEGMIDEEPKEDKEPRASGNRNSEVSFLKEEVLRLRQELSDQHKEAREERQYLVEKLAQLEVNIKKQQQEDARKTQYVAEIKAVNINLHDVEEQLQRVSKEQEAIYERQEKRKRIQQEINEDIVVFATSEDYSVSVPYSTHTFHSSCDDSYLPTEQSSRHHKVPSSIAPVSVPAAPMDFDNYPMDSDIVSNDDNFEMDGEYLAGRSSMDIGPGFSPVVAAPTIHEAPVNTEIQAKSHGHKKAKKETVGSSSGRMTFIPLGSKTEPVVLPKVEKVKIVKSSRSSSSYDNEEIKPKAKKTVRKPSTKTSKEPIAPRMTFVPVYGKKGEARNHLPTNDNNELMLDDIIDNELIEEDIKAIPRSDSNQNEITKKKGKKTPRNTNTTSTVTNNETNKCTAVNASDVDRRAFELFTSANLADVKAMKAGASEDEVSALLRQLWEVATEEERGQWYKADASSSSSPPSSALTDIEKASVDVGTFPDSASKDKDYFPPSPERKKRTTRKRNVKAMELSKEEEEITKQLEALTEPTPLISKPADVVTKPKNLMIAADALPLPSENEGKSPVVPIEDKAKNKMKNKKKAKDEPAPFVFKSKALMMLQEKENSMDVSTDSSKENGGASVKASKGKAKGKGKKSGKDTSNYFDTQEEEVKHLTNSLSAKNTSKAEKISEVSLLSNPSNTSLLNSSVSSIASVLSQNSGKSTFMIPQLKKK